MRYPLALKEIRKKRGLTQAALATMINVEQPTYQRYETGARAVDAPTIEALADALGVTPGELFSPPEIMSVGPRLFVQGAVAAGIWREALQWPEEEWQSFHGRPDVAAPLSSRFGLRVEGDSMNEIYPPGTIIECVLLAGLGFPERIESGKRVVVLRKRSTGEWETTVKEFVVDQDGGEWLVPRSFNPAFQHAIKVRDPEEGIEEVRIIAVVVGSYRPE